MLSAGTSAATIRGLFVPVGIVLLLLILLVSIESILGDIPLAQIATLALGSTIGRGFSPNIPLARGVPTRMLAHVCLPSDGHGLVAAFGGLLWRCPTESRVALGGAAADAKQGLLDGAPCVAASAPKE